MKTKGFRFQLLLSNVCKEMGFATKRGAVSSFKQQGFIQNLDYLVLLDVLQDTEERFREDYLLSYECYEKWCKALARSVGSQVVMQGKTTPPSESSLNRFNGKFLITPNDFDFIRLEDLYRAFSVNGETKIGFGKILKSFLVSSGWEGQKKRCTHGRFKGEWGFTNLKLA